MNHNARVELFDGWAKKYDAAVSPAHIGFLFEGYDEVEVRYKQVSNCGGVFVFVNKKAKDE